MTEAEARLKSLLVEGWVHVPHSYAIVNEWQCIEMLQRQDLTVHLNEPPLYNKTWERRRGLHPPQFDALLDKLTPLPEASTPEAALRISVPVRFGPSPARRTFVMCTADFGWLPRVVIEGQRSLKEALQESEAAIVTPSRFSEWGLLRGGTDPDRIKIVPHGFHPEIFHSLAADERQALRKALGWDGKFILLNISAMTRSKGTDLMLQAFARIAGRYDHAQLVLKGFDNIHRSSTWVKKWWAEKLTAAERDLIRPRINYIGGALTFARMAQLYQAADAYIAPYRSESFNLPVLEAAACGLPVICTAGGPTDDFTTPDFALEIQSKIMPKGRVDRDPEEIVLLADLDHFTDLIAKVIEDEAFRRRALAAGPAYVQPRYTWTQAVDRLLTVMAE